MPLIRFGSLDDYETATKATEPHLVVSNLKGPFREGGFEYYTWHTHTGYCLVDGEVNGRDDSDFVMIFWNPVAQKPERTVFASTRGWSYPSYGSSADATPEVRAAYDAYCVRAEAERRKVIEETNRALADAMGISYAGLLRLKRLGLSDFEFYRLTKLLTSNLRSPMRKSFAQQVRTWAEEETPRFRSPLSQKQWAIV